MLGNVISKHFLLLKFSKNLGIKQNISVLLKSVAAYSSKQASQTKTE